MRTDHFAFKKPSPALALLFVAACSASVYFAIRASEAETSAAHWQRQTIEAETREKIWEAKANYIDRLIAEAGQTGAPIIPPGTILECAQAIEVKDNKAVKRCNTFTVFAPRHR